MSWKNKHSLTVVGPQGGAFMFGVSRFSLYVLTPASSRCPVLGTHAGWLASLNCHKSVYLPLCVVALHHQDRWDPATCKRSSDGKWMDEHSPTNSKTFNVFAKGTLFGLLGIFLLGIFVFQNHFKKNCRAHLTWTSSNNVFSVQYWWIDRCTFIGQVTVQLKRLNESIFAAKTQLINKGYYITITKPTSKFLDSEFPFPSAFFGLLSRLRNVPYAMPGYLVMSPS